MNKFTSAILVLSITAVFADFREFKLFEKNK